MSENHSKQGERSALKGEGRTLTEARHQKALTAFWNVEYAMQNMGFDQQQLAQMAIQQSLEIATLPEQVFTSAASQDSEDSSATEPSDANLDIYATGADPDQDYFAAITPELAEQ